MAAAASEGGGVRYWVSGREERAHKGAGVSAVCFLGGRSVVVAGDEDGKLGLWKVGDVHDDARYLVHGPVVKQKEAAETAAAKQAYAQNFAKEVSRHVSAEALAKSTRAQRRAMLEGSAAAGGLNLATAADGELLQAILGDADLHPVKPDHVTIAEHADDGKVYFNVAGATAGVVGNAFEAAALLSAVGAKAGTGLIERSLKCISWNKSHTPRLRITSVCANAAGNVLYTASIDCTLKVWRVGAGGATLELKHTILLDAPVFSIGCNSSGSAVAVSHADHVVLLHNLPGLEPSGVTERAHEHTRQLQALPEHVRVVLSARGIDDKNIRNVAYQVKCMSVSMSEDGQHVAGAFRVGSRHVSCWVALWSTANSEQVYIRKMDRLKRERASVLLPNNDVVVAFTDPFVLAVKDAKSDPRLVASTGAPIDSLVAHPSGNVAWVACTDGRVCGINVDGSAALAKPGESVAVRQVTASGASADGGHVAFGSAEGGLVMMSVDALHTPCDVTPIPFYSPPLTTQQVENGGAPALNRMDTQMLATQEFPELTQFEPSQQPITSQGLYLNREESAISSQATDAGLVRTATQASDVFGDVEPDAKRAKPTQ